MSKLVHKINLFEQKLQKSFQPLNVIEISRSAVLKNFDALKSLNNGFNIFPVLKSNAYGHGLCEVTEILKDRRFPYIAVDSYFEALKIRAISKQPVLIMGAIHPSNFNRIKVDNFAFVVGDRIQLETLGKMNRHFKIHVDINTGMNRQGFELNDIRYVMRKFAQYKKLKLEGVMSHLADADNPRSDIYSETQINKFDNAVEKILDSGHRPAYIHLANSPGSVKVQSKYANAIRPGFALYGLNPLLRGDKQRRKYSKLQPALTLKSSIVKIIKLERGDRVSYNGIFTAVRNTQVAVLPLGYYEGIPRELSNKGWVGYKKSWLRYSGRVCMNHTIVELGKTRAKLWDSVTVISNNPEHRNSVQKLYDANGLFNYALIAGLNQNIRRVIVD